MAMDKNVIHRMYERCGVELVMQAIPAYVRRESNVSRRKWGKKKTPELISGHSGSGDPPSAMRINSVGIFVPPIGCRTLEKRIHGSEKKNKYYNYQA
jgi:hypothetical protein